MVLRDRCDRGADRRAFINRPIRGGQGRQIPVRNRSDEFAEEWGQTGPECHRHDLFLQSERESVHNAHTQRQGHVLMRS